MDSTCREYIRTAKTHNNPTFQHFQERPRERDGEGKNSGIFDI